MKNEPAFPTHEVWDNEKTDIGWIGGGLTKRELFAAMAMQGILSGPPVEGVPSLTGMAVRYADALIAELEKCEK